MNCLEPRTNYTIDLQTKCLQVYMQLYCSKNTRVLQIPNTIILCLYSGIRTFVRVQFSEWPFYRMTFYPKKIYRT